MDTASTSGSSRAARDAAQASAAAVAPRPTAASAEVKFLSPSRKAAWRLPDTLQRIQLTRPWSKLDARFTAVFRAYIRESEQNSIADIRISNDVDFEPCPPCDFCWTDRYIYTPGLPSLRLPEGMQRGCDCDDDECEPATCACQTIGRQFYPDQYAMMDAEEATRGPRGKKHFFAYDENGRLQEPFSTFTDMPIWECNEYCGCDLSACPNRVVQRGRTVGLDIFKTKEKGWGVRTIDAVPKGTFVCLYSGELITVKEEELRGTTYEAARLNYLLDLDSHLTRLKCHVEPYERALAEKHGEAWVREEKARVEAMNEGDEDNRAAEACTHDHDHLAVDGCLWGNASRYFNSSCDPNMAIWPVWLSSRDFRHYHPSFFTIRDVEAGEELTFRYSGKDKSNIKKATQKQKQNEDARRLADSDVEGEAEQDEAAQDDDAPAEPELEPIYCRCGAANCKKALLFDVAGPPQVRAAKQKQLRKELQHIEARSEHGGEAE